MRSCVALSALAGLLLSAPAALADSFATTPQIVKVNFTEHITSTTGVANSLCVAPGNCDLVTGSALYDASLLGPGGTGFVSVYTAGYTDFNHALSIQVDGQGIASAYYKGFIAGLEFQNGQLVGLYVNSGDQGEHEQYNQNGIDFTEQTWDSRYYPNGSFTGTLDVPTIATSVTPEPSSLLLLGTGLLGALPGLRRLRTKRATAAA